MLSDSSFFVMAESGGWEEESCCAVFEGEAGEPTALASGTAESDDEDVASAESGRAAPELVHGSDAAEPAAEPDVVAAGFALVDVVSAPSSPQPANAMAANDKIATHLYIWPLLLFGTSASFVQLSFRARQLAIQSAVAVGLRAGVAAAGEARAKVVDTADDDREAILHPARLALFY